MGDHHHHHHHGHSCASEAHGHGHGHGHGDCDHEELERGDEVTLFPFIDTTKVRVLNAKDADMASNPFKPWSERLTREPFVESDDDDAELLIYVPFTGSVKLKSLNIVGGDHGLSPSEVRLYINRDDLDFSSVEDMEPVQSFELTENFDATHEHNTRMSRFQSVSELVLYFPDNHGADCTRITYIGLKGDFTPLKREAVETVYESAPQAANNDPLKNIDRVAF